MNEGGRQQETYKHNSLRSRYTANMSDTATQTSLNNSDATHPFSSMLYNGVTDRQRITKWL